MRQSLVEKIHTLAVHWGFFLFFINDFANLAHCPWSDFVDDKNLFGLAPDLKACEIYKLWISECFCRVIAIKLATFVDSKIIKFKCLNLQWFPNLFRSFSNHWHHFPEETNRIPLKVQLISHLRICSHFSRYNSFSFTNTICRYWYMQNKICIQAKLLQAKVLEPRKTDVLESGYRSLASERRQYYVPKK